MTMLKSEAFVSRATPLEDIAREYIHPQSNGIDEAYLALEEDDYQDDHEDNQLINNRIHRTLPGLRGGARNVKGPTFADVIIKRLGLSKMQSRMINSDVYSAASGQRQLNGRAPPPPPGAPKLYRSPSVVKSLLTILLFIILIICFVLFIIELSTFVGDEKTRNANFKGDLRKLKHKFFNELERKLDDAHRKEIDAERKSRWLVTSPKCHIPVLDPWDPSIASYISKKSPMNCSSLIRDFFDNADKDVRSRINTTTKSLSYVVKNMLFFTQEAIHLGALDGRCCYRLLTRSFDNDDDLDQSEECILIRGNGVSMVGPSLIEVSCGPPLNYANVHTFMLQNGEEENAYEKVANVKLNKKDHYNVLMVGVDTMSRLNALRQLNQTMSLLMGEVYNALDFVGYNKVGENTFPNLIPLLTGLRPDQLVETHCWLAKNYNDKDETGDDYLDNCTYLWNFYQRAGYATYFSEDWPAASTFNYLKPGFKNEPTTYYGRPFVLARNKFTIPQFNAPGCASCQLDRPIVQVDLENLQVFLDQHQTKPYFAFHWINCPQHDDLNGASAFDVILADFFQKIHRQTQDDKTFVIFFSDHGYRWNDFVSTRIGHYESSLPLLTIAPPKSFISKHPDLYQRLKEHQNALLTPFDIFKTLIGIRDLSMSAGAANLVTAKDAFAGKISGKRQAVIPMLPGFANPILPHPFPVTMDVALAPGVRYSAMLGAQMPNATMPIEGVSTASFNEVKMKDGITFEQKFKTISLLDRHRSAELDRSCIEAGIPDNYCVCHQFEPIEADRLDVLGAAYYLVYGHLDSHLKDHYNLCRELDLEKIHQAELFDFAQMSSAKRLARHSTRDRRASSKSDITTLQPSSVKTTSEREASNRFDHMPKREYSIMFSTKPGGALFQEVVRFYGTSMDDCEKAILRARDVVDDGWAYLNDRRTAVKTMNSICQFSVHSESISRFNLYKDQSKCVKSNIELKKICYCNDIK